MGSAGGVQKWIVTGIPCRKGTGCVFCVRGHLTTTEALRFSSSVSSVLTSITLTADSEKSRLSVLWGGAVSPAPSAISSGRSLWWKRPASPAPEGRTGEKITY